MAIQAGSPKTNEEPSMLSGAHGAPTKEESRPTAAHRQRFPLVAVIISSIGLMVDLYDFGIINNVKQLLEADYGEMSAWQKSSLSASALIGAFSGMLVIGGLGDRCGRRAMFLLCASLTFIGSALSACAWNPGDNGIYTLLITFRFIMGFGIGGEYPTTASHTAESSDSSSSARNLALIVAAMGIGSVLAPAVVLICLKVGFSYEVTWRIAFGVGAVVSLVNFLLSFFCIEDSESFNQEQASKEEYGLRRSIKELRKYAKLLVGTCGAWFLYDVIDYGLGLFSEEISADATGASIEVSVGNVLMYAVMASPGAFIAAYVVPRVGRKETYLPGVTGMLCVFFVLAAFYEQMSKNKAVFTFFYGLQLLFDYSGPQSVTLMIPAEVFPTSVRATAVGISAAAGKLGAIVGVYVVGMVNDALGVRWVFIIIGGVCLIAILFAMYFLPCYNGRTLKELEHLDKHGSREDLKRWLYGGGARGMELPKDLLWNDAVNQHEV